jgi:hypothetical protein
VLSSGFGLYKYQTRSVPTEVSFGEESDLHLIPTWLPDGTKLTLEDYVGTQMYGQPGETSVWRSGKQVVTLSSNQAPGQGSGSSFDKAMAAVKTQTQDGQYADWKVDSVNVILSARPSIPTEDFIRLAQSVAIDSERGAKLAAAPLGLPLTFSGLAKELMPTRQWSMWALNPTGGQGISISALLPSSAANRAYGDSDIQAVPPSEVTTVNGHDATVATITNGALKTAFVSWSQNGWNVQVWGTSRDKILKVANGLKVATQQEWEDFPRMNRGGSVHVDPIERRKALDVAATVPVGSGELTLIAADLISEKGCVNMKLEGTGQKDEFCLKPSGKPVLWSAVRTVGGKKSVVAIVDLHVDSVTLTSEGGDASTQIISAKTISDETPAGFVVDTSVEGDKYSWLGVAVLPFEGDSPGRIEPYFNTEFDRDAPSAEADPTGGPDGDPSTDEDEYDAPLKSLGRFDVGG